MQNDFSFNIFQKDANVLKKVQKSADCVIIHFVNHHSLIQLLENHYQFNRLGNIYYVDGSFLSFALKMKGIPHFYRPGPNFLGRFIRLISSEKFSAICPSSPVSNYFQNTYKINVAVPGNLGMHEGTLLGLDCLDIKHLECENILIGVGSPKQEYLATELSKNMNGVTFLCVGAALNFEAGIFQRAPKLVRKMRLEWLFRLLQEPLKTLPRLTLSTYKFIKLLIK